MNNNNIKIPSREFLKIKEFLTFDEFIELFDFKFHNTFAFEVLIPLRSEEELLIEGTYTISNNMTFDEQEKRIKEKIDKQFRNRIKTFLIQKIAENIDIVNNFTIGSPTEKQNKNYLISIYQEIKTYLNKDNKIEDILKMDNTNNTLFNKFVIPSLEVNLEQISDFSDKMSIKLTDSIKKHAYKNILSLKDIFNKYYSTLNINNKNFIIEDIERIKKDIIDMFGRYINKIKNTIGEYELNFHYDKFNQIITQRTKEFIDFVAEMAELPEETKDEFNQYLKDFSKKNNINPINTRTLITTLVTLNTLQPKAQYELLQENKKVEEERDSYKNSTMFTLGSLGLLSLFTAILFYKWYSKDNKDETITAMQKNWDELLKEIQKNEEKNPQELENFITRIEEQMNEINEKAEYGIQYYNKNPEKKEKSINPKDKKLSKQEQYQIIRDKFLQLAQFQIDLSKKTLSDNKEANSKKPSIAFTEADMSKIITETIPNNIKTKLMTAINTYNDDKNIKPYNTIGDDCVKFTCPVKNRKKNELKVFVKSGKYKMEFVLDKDNNVFNFTGNVFIHDGNGKDGYDTIKVDINNNKKTANLVESATNKKKK